MAHSKLDTEARGTSSEEASSPSANELPARAFLLPYAPPQLRLLGNVAQLTFGGSKTVADSAFTKKG